MKSLLKAVIPLSARVAMRRTMAEAQSAGSLTRYRIASPFDRARLDKRIPPRALNFDSMPTPDIGEYACKFVTNARDKELPFWVAKCGLKPSSRVLDYGCGLGRSAMPLSDYLTTGSYYGVDIVPRAVAWLRRAYAGYPNFTFDHLRLQVEHYEKRRLIGPAVVNWGGDDPASVRIDAADDSFDLQISTSIFTHMYAVDIVPTLCELGRVTKPGGVCYNTWFLVDDGVLASIEAGTADRTLPHEKDGMYYSDPSNILMGTAYHVHKMRQIYADAGHEITGVFRGSWAGTGADNGALYQDIVLSRPYKTP